MIIVPVYSNFEWQDFKVLVKPCGVRKLLRFLPYFTGSSINLSLSVETISGKQREFAYRWICSYRGANDLAQTIESKSITFCGNPQKEDTTIAKVPRLSYRGFYEIQVSIIYPIKDGNNSPSKTVVDFHTIERDAFTIKLLFILVAALAGAIGRFLPWLSQRFSELLR